MNNLQEIKIFIIDRSRYKAEMLKRAFEDVPNVVVEHYDLKQFYYDNQQMIECLVSPANSFGRMTGGYDAVLSDILGWDFQYKVQDYIEKHYYGEQIVGTSFIIDTDIDGLKLIHTPSMKYPSLIKDDMVVYYCMRSTLMCALENGIKNIVIPIFGGACGGVDAALAGTRMREAYDQILNRQGPEWEF